MGRVHSRLAALPVHLCPPVLCHIDFTAWGNDNFRCQKQFNGLRDIGNCAGLCRWDRT